MIVLKLIALLFVLGIIGGTVYVAMTDTPVHQETITKTLPNDDLLNDE